jgi:hypothetical protein
MTFISARKASAPELGIPMIGVTCGAGIFHRQ